MIISRTPFRISFFGGGTDYPNWYLKNGGCVLATTINKYCYISCRVLPPFFEHNIRVVYSRIENCRNIEEIQHPSVRETLRFLKLTAGLEIHHDGDLPARSGLGSSSAFTVGLLHALYALKGYMPHKKQLARESIHIEQNLIKETVGSQDQICAAFGGLNHICFDRNNDFQIRPLPLSTARQNELTRHLMLFYTGINRTASDVAKSYTGDMESRRDLLTRIGGLVEESIEVLNGGGTILKFGELLDEAWQVKRNLSRKVSNGYVNHIYDRAKSAGAIGGKLLGAGGGGFLLLFASPSVQIAVRDALSELIHVPFEMEHSGSQIIFFEPQTEDYTASCNDWEKRNHQHREKGGGAPCKCSRNTA